MVRLAVPRFGMVAELNFARSYLFRAADALNANRLLECGVLLREAVRRQLWAECCWFGCLPADAGEKTSPRSLLKALRKAGHTNECGYQVVWEAIEFGNRAAHCGRVRANYLRTSILFLHDIIDACPANEPANMPGLPQPVECQCWDDDDNDPADWWKREGGAI